MGRGAVFLRTSLLGRSGVKPLSWMGGTSLLAYSRGKLLTLELDSGLEQPLCNLPLGNIKRLLSHSRMASRLLRIEPRSAIVVGDAALVTWMGAVLLIDLRDGSLSVLSKPRVGFSSPLYFTPVSGLGFSAVWGDYGTNPNRAPVAIHGLDDNGDARVLYEFEPGVIRHVHGIVARKVGNGGYYVLTGDMEKSSGIYVASQDFSSVEPLAVGEQRFRAVRGFPVEDGLVYATDSASIENHIYRLNEDGGGAWSQLDDLGTLNGPCIYGGEIEGGFLFTTTIEPDESQSGVASYLSNQTGPGVLTPDATAVVVTGEGIIREVARVKDDGLPLKAFQYGSLQVPAGIAPGDDVWLYARSLAKMDGRAIKVPTGGENG